MDSIDSRNDSYLKMISSANLSNLQEGILRFIKLYPDSTDQLISEQLDLDLSCVNGRRNELVEKGLVVATKGDWSSGRHRTTWRLATAEEYSNFKNKDTSLNNKDMNKLRELISRANNYQKQIARDLLK